MDTMNAVINGYEQSLSLLACKAVGLMVTEYLVLSFLGNYPCNFELKDAE